MVKKRVLLNLEGFSGPKLQAYLFVWVENTSRLEEMINKCKNEKRRGTRPEPQSIPS